MLFLGNVTSKTYWKILWLLLALHCGLNSAMAKQDSLAFSLLTCGPGEQVYELFGHTGVRCRNLSTGEDVVYNYGIFDFREPDFLMLFARGETDYILGVQPYRYFEFAYRMRGSSLIEQPLNLEQKECVWLDSLLRENALPQNRTYRYNYFYNNCTTRARDCIENALDGEIRYPSRTEYGTYREWVQKCVGGHPWIDFGIGLCLGAEADRALSEREQLFLPDNLRQAFSQAVVYGSNGRELRQLVKDECEILQESPALVEHKDASPFTPMLAAWLLFGLVAFCSWVEWKRRCVCWPIDILLFAMQGLAGCVIAFLFFCSEHPAVDSNYLLIILNPLPLLYLPILIYKVIKGKKDPYDMLNIVVLTLFIAFLPLIPQKISLVIVPLALNLLIRSILHLVIANEKVRRRKE